MSDSISPKLVWPNYNANNVKAAAKKTSDDSLGKDQFLKILVTQLRNQDPMQPMQDRDFIAQMAQFSSVEQLMNMSNELTLMRQNMGSASSLIGKTIEWNEYNETGQIETFYGVVDSIIAKDGVLHAKVGSTEIAMDYIISIANERIESGEQEQEPDNGEGTEEEVATP